MKIIATLFHTVTRSKQRLFNIHRIKPAFVKIKKNLAMESLAYLKHTEQKQTKKTLSRRKSVCGRNLFLINEEVVERGFDYPEDDMMADITAAPPITNTQPKFITLQHNVEYKKCAAMENLCAYNSSEESDSEEICGECGDKANADIQQPAADVCLLQELQPNTEMSNLFESCNENQVFTSNQQSLKSNKENQFPKLIDIEKLISSETINTPLYPKALPKLLPILPNNHAPPSFLSTALKEKNNFGASNITAPIPKFPSVQLLQQPDVLSPKILPQLLPININNFNTFNPFRRLPNMPFTLSGRQRSKSVDSRLNNDQGNIKKYAMESIQEIQPLHTKDHIAESIETANTADNSDSFGTLLYDGSSDDPSILNILT